MADGETTGTVTIPTSVFTSAGVEPSSINGATTSKSTPSDTKISNVSESGGTVTLTLEVDGGGVFTGELETGEAEWKLSGKTVLITTNYPGMRIQI